MRWGIQGSASRPKNYIGIACTLHDPAIAVVDSSGNVVFAEAGERHLQTKRAFGCVVDDPSFSDRVLEKFVEPDADIVVAKTWSRASLRAARMGNCLRAAIQTLIPLRHRWSDHLELLRFVLRRQINTTSVASESLRYRLRYPKSPLIANHRVMSVKHFNHHLTHAATGCFTSPFREAVCAVIDAYGEDSSTGFYSFSNERIKPLRYPKSRFGSLGWFYSLVCIGCGFDWIQGEEWKVMGMAPYGKFDNHMYAKLSAMLQVEGLKIRGGRRMMLDPFWRENHSRNAADLAHTGQVVFEECLEKLLNNLGRQGISDNLVYMGGCALNSSANGKILNKTPFKNLHIYSAPADDGSAIGAALLAYAQDQPYSRNRIEPLTPYLGESMDSFALKNLETFNGTHKLRRCGQQICTEAARLLAEGKLVGWIQGRAEFGPRALGNRSILADPRNPNVKDLINERVKFREEFRPFAPSILHEFGPQYFEDYTESPYMERTLRFRSEVQDKVPGVVHINNTGRLQTVKREWNERYYLLLKEFHRQTGVPLLLNTSFNVMGKPIVNSVEDAVAVFYTTGLDAMVIDDLLFEK